MDRFGLTWRRNFKIIIDKFFFLVLGHDIPALKIFLNFNIEPQPLQDNLMREIHVLGHLFSRSEIEGRKRIQNFHDDFALL